MANLRNNKRKSSRKGVGGRGCRKSVHIVNNKCGINGNKKNIEKNLPLNQLNILEVVMIIFYL
jgi:hypothetical protein